jgi:hypothetical protein
MVWFFFVEQKEPATTHQRTNKRIVFAKMIVVLLAVKTLYPKLPIWAKYFGHGYSIPISKVLILLCICLANQDYQPQQN